MASAAPTLGLGFASCVVGAGLSALVGLGSTTSALAACVAPNPAKPNEIVCSGTETTQQDITVKDAQITTSADFSVNVPTQFTRGISIDAVSTSAGGGITFTSTTSKEIRGTYAGLEAKVGSGDGDLTITIGKGAVTGGQYGIVAEHPGTGAVTIKTGDGNVTGQGNDGIFGFIINRQNDSALTITTGTGAVKGGQNGIFATHAGTGAVTIETNGDITGTAVAGIDAQIGNQNNTGGNGELNITANAAVTGGQYGIFAKHYGLGAVTIKTGDRDVTGTNEYGIYAKIFNQNNTNDITITTGTGAVTGGKYGIFTDHRGLGAVTITTGDGNVTGTNEYGIYAEIFNANNTNDIKITTGTGAVKGRIGIHATHQGAGALTIETNGDITGTKNDGIFADILTKITQTT